MHNYNTPEKPLIGSWLMMEHISIAEIMARAGFDWLCVDIEHTAIDFYGLQTMLLAIQANNIKAFVRVSSNDPVVIKRAMDAGADGIIIPMVNSYAEALLAIDNCRYPGKGKRGVGLARAQNYGLDQGFESYRDNVADNIPIIVQIEHYNAVNDLDRILELEDIAGSFIGPYDLSGSLGKPGMFEAEEVLSVLKKYDEITKRFPNKLKGVHVIQPDANLVNQKIEQGYNFIAFSIDTLFLGNKCREELKRIKTV
jgi:2-dehydro-3-deoxyglucarate aldolase